MAQEARIRIEDDQTPEPVATDASRAAQPSSSSAARSGTPAPPSRKESDFPFAVSVSDVYEGPLDLLLDLIRKQDIDIYDIPIAKITAPYLMYVEKLLELDVNVAAEFIYKTAMMIHIWAMMLNS